MKIFSSFSLKIIGIVTMTIDHLGVMIFPDQLWMRIVGRAAFPIFAFLIAEGFRHTKNVNKYLFRLLLFAIVLELPILLLSSFTNYLDTAPSFPLNIFFTLALGLALLIIIEKEKKHYYLIPLILIFTFFADVNYGYYGLITILMMYYLKGYILLFCWIFLNGFFYLFRMITPELFLHQNYGIDFASYQITALYAIVFIFLYNGKKGKDIKYFFYFYYPFHVMVIYGISLLL